MNKELIDHVWKHCLPKEFKEEVKKEWQTANDEERFPHDAFLRGCYSTMVLLFGYHNLTSDAEGEEILTCEKSKVQAVYKTSKEIVNNEQYGTCQYSMHTQIMCVLENLFGSKCLPDGNKECSNPSVVNCKHKHGDGTCSLSGMCCYKSPKPAEPEEKDDCQKFTKRLDDTLEGDIKEPFKEWRDKNSSNVEKLEKIGEIEPKPTEPKFKCEDRVRIIKKNHPYYGKIATVDTLVNGPYPEVLVNLRGNLISFNKSDLKPYTEQKESLCMDAKGFYRKETDTQGNKVKVRIPFGETEPYTKPKEESPQMKPIESKVRVYLATKEEDEEFRQLLYKNGFKWNTGESLIDNSVWSFDKEESKIHNIYPNKIVTYSGDITLNILPFSKFKKQYFEEKSHNLSQEIANCDKHFDNILRDGFSKERRLNIAAMVMQGIMANPNPQMVEMDVHRVADLAILMADTLIAECEKGGPQ
jgi:hypothetical protein